MVHFGANVYWWSQTRPTEVLRALRRLAVDPASSPRRLFYDYFDARGPHLFVLLSAAGPVDGAAIAETLREALELETAPADISSELAEARHQACLGKELCAMDSHHELVPHRQLLTFVQPPDAYPFWLGRDLLDAKAFWQGFSELTLLGLDLLLAGPVKQAGTAIEWMIAIDEWLEPRGFAEAYWRFHLSTLMPGLRAELELGTLPEDLREGLESSVGDRNREVFSKIRGHAERRHFAPLLPDLCQSATGSPVKPYFVALRELNHVFLKQLGVPPVQQLPFVLYSWLHHLKLHQGKKGAAA